MILLYTPKITNRIQYIAKTLLGELCGMEYKVTASTEEFLNFKGAKINYSDRELPGTALTIYASGLLLEKGIKDFVPSSVHKDNIPYLFPHSDTSTACDLGFDIFSACFYMLSRYEEYLPYLEDVHGRFEADQSLAFMRGFLDMPVVDIYAMKLRQMIIEAFPFVEYTSRSFCFIPTYDIDAAYAYKGKGFARNLFLFLKDFLTLNYAELIYRIKVLTGVERDPFDTYDFQLALQKKHKLEPIYFFLSGHYGPKDKNISIHSNSFYNLVKTLSDYAFAGLHPSYKSNSDSKVLQQELDFLSGVLNRTIDSSRQHYLMLKLPQTYQNLIKINIKNDYTMGFASHTGFRAGTCSPFNFYDLSLETETRLRIFPLAVMDGTMHSYMKMKPDEALEHAKKIVDQVKAVDGTFISLWHNDALGDTGHWKGWKYVYTELLEYIHSSESLPSSQPL
jgi:hypothetical protein